MGNPWVHRPLKPGEKLTAVFVRDELIECFFTSQKEILALAAQAMHRGGSDAEIRGNVTQIIRMAFQEVGGSFDEPTKASILQVMEVLRRKSTATGKAAEIVEYHARQMMELVQQLAG